MFSLPLLLSGLCLEISVIHLSNVIRRLNGTHAVQSSQPFLTRYLPFVPFI